MPRQTQSTTGGARERTVRSLARNGARLARSASTTSRGAAASSGSGGAEATACNDRAAQSAHVDSLCTSTWRVPRSSTWTPIVRSPRSSNSGAAAMPPCSATSAKAASRRGHRGSRRTKKRRRNVMSSLKVRGASPKRYPARGSLWNPWWPPDCRGYEYPMTGWPVRPRGLQTAATPPYRRLRSAASSGRPGTSPGWQITCSCAA